MGWLKLLYDFRVKAIHGLWAIDEYFEAQVTYAYWVSGNLKMDIAGAASEIWVWTTD